MLALYKVYGNSAVLVLKGRSLKSVNAPSGSQPTICGNTTSPGSGIILQSLSLAIKYISASSVIAITIIVKTTNSLLSNTFCPYCI